MENFTIENEHGRITWEGETDLTQVDLAEVVTISHKAFEVYDDKMILKKPQVGEKLNKEAVVTLFNFNLRKAKTLEEAEEFLIKQMKKNECLGEHIRYDIDQQQWTFRMFAFIK